MYLSKLDIVGFKSFAQKTNFTFSQGLSALVGPNGCGKTNIVDAIRWVLGEKKASVLRSDVMENVIFNGTKTRKPLGMAEVTLTIENNKNILPIEYSQVTVSRRLYRSGESEYYLNKTKCRLKDILDLFLDTGLGSDSYSVIELKMVEAILSGRVDDRRALFEEAAGIKKYKIRRKETAKKLESVQSDLERVKDIVEEVRKNVNSLSRQAAKTKRYNSLMEQLRETEIKMLQHDFHNISISSNSLSSELNELNKLKIKSEFEIFAEEKNISELKENLHKITREHQESVESEKSLNNQLYFAKEKLAAKKAKLDSFDTTKSILLNQIEETKSKISELEFKISSNNSQLEILKSEYNEAENELKNKFKIKLEASQIVIDLRDNSGSANEEVLELQNRINSLKSVIDRNNLKKLSIENKINKNEEEISSLNNQKEELLRDIDSLRSRLAEFDIDLINAEDSFNTEQERKNSLQSSIDNLRDKLSSKKNDLNSKKSAVEFLKGLVDNNESSKHLLKNENWNPDYEKILLGEAVGADEEYRVAIDAALGDYSHSFIVNNKDDADKAIKSLIDSKKGRASFIIRELIPIIESPKEISQSGICGYLSELVRVEDDLRNALRLIAGDTLIADNSEAALIAIKDKLSSRVVTLSGEIYELSGYIKGGSKSSKEGQSIGKKERLNKLNQEIKALMNEISDIENDAEALKDEFNSIDLIVLRNNIKKIENEINNFTHRINQTELKETAIDDKLQLIANSKENFQNEINEMEAENTKFFDELEIINENINKSREVYQSVLNELAKAEENLKIKENEARQQEIKKINIAAEIRNIENETKNLSRELESSNIRIEAKQEELETGEENKEILLQETIALNSDIENLSNRKDEVSNKSDILQTEKTSIQEQYEQYGESLNQKRKESDKIKEKIHEKEIILSEYKIKLENINNKVIEDYKTNLLEAEFTPDSDFNINSAKNEVADTKDKLSKLGNVNFMALEEFEQQSARLDFYDKQMADLTDSEKILKETMDEINNAAETNFRDTFVKIRDNFKNLFKTLFGPEGEADIKLAVEDNPLESDIEITAKPPFKKPHSIELLSGGEKTLTAIALLFGIYLVKPSPFCILDEVDAPLDDKNIEKFINLIREFSNNTQFLIVTHNKGTMEAADTLYGVTMQEDGISKVVSVKVDENTENSSAA